MNIGKVKRFLVFFLSIAMVFTMMPTSVFANAGGGGSRSGSFTGSSGTAERQPIVYVWFDDARDSVYDRTDPNAKPVQGGWKGKNNSGHWVKAQNGQTTIEWWISAIQKKLRQKGGRDDFSDAHYNKKLGGGKKNEERFISAAKDACIRANKRAATDDPTARIVAVAVTLLWDRDTHGWWFGGHANDGNWEKYKNMLPREGKSSELKPWDKLWNTKVPKQDKNLADGKKTWHKYIYDLGYRDVGDANIKNGYRYIVLAVNNYEPTISAEFETKLANLGNTSDGVKLDVTEPGNVKAKDEILYKNLDKTDYTVSAKLCVSDDVSLVKIPEVEQPDPPDADDEISDSGSMAQTYQSEDGVVSMDGKTISIDAENEAYANYTGGSFWALVFGRLANDEIDWDNPTVTELVNEDTTIECNENDIVTVVYSPTMPDADTDPVLLKVVYIPAAEQSDETQEADIPDTSGDEVPDGLVIGKVDKVTPVASFKTGSGQDDWQTGSFVTLKGNHNGYIDLYKDGLYNGVGDFTKVYKAGVKAVIYDGNAVFVQLNTDLKNGDEATPITNPFGTLTFDKQAVYNHKTASVVETGAKFNVYSNEYSSYEDAVADAQAKGYETYKYEQITIAEGNVNHGDVYTDNIQWKLHNGMLVPGTYVIEETSAGYFSKSNRLVDKFEILVERGQIGTRANNEAVENPHYTYNLTVEKRTVNQFRSQWEPEDEDHLYSKLTQFKIESLDDKQNAMGNGNKQLPTADNRNGSLLSSVGFTRIANTNAWTIELNDLPSGRYRITENAPLGYWLPASKSAVEFVIHRDMEGEIDDVDVINSHDYESTYSGFAKLNGQSRVDIRKSETKDSTSYAVTFTRSNVPQESGLLKLYKSRDTENVLGNDVTEGFPFVEFNLYADPDNPLTEAENDGGDIRAYDGHKDHVYYTAGQLVQGIVIDEETGDRHYYKDGKEVNMQTWRIMTDRQGNWDSSQIYTGENPGDQHEPLTSGSDQAFKYYPLTNNNMIDTYTKDGTPTGEKDGVSFYKLQEMYIWQYGDHISFTNDQKNYLKDFWTENYTKEGTVYGSLDEKIPDIGLSMNQILNHGIDITENDTENGGRTGEKTYTYSAFGIQLDHDDVVMDFLREYVLQYVDPANGTNDTTASIKDKHNVTVGTIEYNLLVLWPDQKTEFPKIGETYSEFQILPDNIDETRRIEVPSQDFSNPAPPRIKTVAEVNEPGNHKYDSSANKVTIHDTVSYYNLKPGREYTMIGSLYNINPDIDADGNDTWSLGDPILDANGDVLTVEQTFVPTNKKGKIDMSFDVTPKQLNFDNVVVTEKCMLGEDLIAQEVSPATESQQAYTEGGMLIETQAEYNGKHIMPNDSDVTFTDTVEYWGLTPGTEYTLKGTLMEKDGSENGTPVQVNGKDVTVEHKFTAIAKHSQEVVPFEINTSDLDGKSVVVFEELCDANGAPLLNEDGTAVEHKDINDDNQTIIIPSVKTTAADGATEEHVGEKNKKSTVIDVVEYTNLIPGEKYTVSGKLMKKPKAEPQVEEQNTGDNTANAPASTDAEPKAPEVTTGTYEVLAEASKSFTAEEANGSIELKFTVNSEDLAGHSAVAFETITDDETGVEIAIHRDINDPDQTIDYPDIRTTALDGNIKLHVGEFGTTVSIIDTVMYENLTPGLEYELSGTMMDKATGDPLKIDGKVVKSSKKFTPTEASGSEDLEFEIDSTKLGGTSIVAFEELTFKDVLVAEHKNIEDPEQTVNYPEIKTVAVDAKTKTHEGLASADVNIVDTVKYTNLTPGVEYIVRGVLMDKETGDVYIAGKGDTAGVAESTADKAADAAAKLTDAVENATPKTEEQADTPKAQTGAEEQNAEGNGEQSVSDDANKDGDTPKVDEITPEATDADADKVSDDSKKDVAKSADVVPGGVYGEIKFTPETADGEVEIPFNIKNGDVAGKQLVAFESIFVVNEKGEEVEVGRHEDITDPDQTVGYPEIRTNAVDADSGEHVGLARDNITVKDKVTYKGLTPGQKYTVVGTLMDKETGKALVAGSDAKAKDKAKAGSDGTTSTTDANVTANPVGTAVALGHTANVYNWGAIDKYTKATNYVSYDLFIADENTDMDNAVGKPYVGEKISGIANGSYDSLKLTSGDSLPTFLDKIDPGQEGAFYAIVYLPKSVDGVDAFGLITIHVKNNGSEAATMGSCTITSIDKHLDATEQTTPKTEEQTPAEKAAEGAQTSGAITAQKTFTAENSEGSVEIEFTFTGVDMSNKAAVAFEKLYAGGEVVDDNLVATHEDINDPDQTVYYPTIDTKASYKDGIITDTVTYTNLIPGLEYELTGTLMDKSSGNSMEISAMTKFTPKEANGTVDMKFEVEKDKVAGKSIVVFETLKLNGKVVAEHHDINDKDQTVTIDKKNPSKETKQSKDSKKSDGTDRASYKTGDFLPYILMAVLAMLLASIYVVQRRRRREE